MTLVEEHYENTGATDSTDSSTPDNSLILSELENRLVGLLDLQLTLKHIHWNVTGESFIAVHNMLDEQVASVREMTDAVAERIATRRGVPIGTPQHLVQSRTWQDYHLGRAAVVEHMTALNNVYDGVIGDHRSAAKAVRDIDPVSEDLLIAQLATLELYQWFVRSHLGQ